VETALNPLNVIKLSALMLLSRGSPRIRIALIDGPVMIRHPDLARENIHVIRGQTPGVCTQANSEACVHGTFVAGILAAKRGSIAPAICPDCTLLVRPIFSEGTSNEQIPSATPEELGRAIMESVDAGAHVVNLSAGLAHFSANRGRVEESLTYAARHGVLVVAAAGNQATIGSSAITRHPWVIPVVACDFRGVPTRYSNLGRSIGRHGWAAPGENIISLGPAAEPYSFGGTSAATPFVTGAIALLWSEFPQMNAADIRAALESGCAYRRRTIVPPLFDAWAAYQSMAGKHVRA
jgi:subtilisin family serine protease